MRTLSTPVYMLAADHRWQWEQWCDQHGVGRSRIPEAKALALDGLLHARAAGTDARRSGALLIDRQYAAPEIDRAMAAGVTVGTPAEKPGVFPLEWTASPFHAALAGDFAKVLVRHRPEWPREVQEEQLARVRQLAQWCAGQALPLVLEVVVMRESEPEEEFEAVGRPRIVAGFIARAYAAGIVPDYWKIEGATERSAVATLDRAIRQQDGPKLLILGKGAGFELIDRWFDAAAGAPSAAGFAIGRSVYWDPATRFLSGRISRDDAVAAVAGNYQRVIDSWNRYAGLSA